MDINGVSGTQQTGASIATAVGDENKVVGQFRGMQVTVNTKGESGIAEHVDGARTLGTGQGGKPHNV